MTRAEVYELLAAMLDRWEHAKTRLEKPGVIRQYERDLAEVLPEHAAIAVETWYRDEHRFAPSGAEIVGRIADLALNILSLDWVDVKVHLQRRAATAGHRAERQPCPLDECDGSGLAEVYDPDAWPTTTTRPCACRESRPPAGAGVHPVLAEFIALVGERELSGVVAGDRVADAQVKDKWLSFVRTIRRQIAYQGLPDGGLAGMQRLAAEAADRLPRLLPGGAERMKTPLVAGRAMHAIVEHTRPEPAS